MKLSVILRFVIIGLLWVTVCVWYVLRLHAAGGGDYTDGIVSGAGIRHNRFCAALQEICETWRK